MHIGFCFILFYFFIFYFFFFDYVLVVRLGWEVTMNITEEKVWREKRRK
jgi:hypothetical protein